MPTPPSILEWSPGLETGNEIGGSPDRPMTGHAPDLVETAAERVCRRIPWMADGDFRTAHGGQDGMTPDQRALLGPAGPDGFHLLCGFSGTGFKTAPAIGLGMAEWILDGAATSVDIAPFAYQRYLDSQPLVGEHGEEILWR